MECALCGSLESLLRILEREAANSDALKRQAGSGANSMAHFSEKIEELTSENKILRKAAADIESKSAKAGALASQAESSQKEYMRVLEENKELKTHNQQLSDEVDRVVGEKKELFHTLQATENALVNEGDKKND
jgi:seryl-tRNA synthetase